MVKFLSSRQLVVVVGVKWSKTMPSGGEIDATHAPGRGGELDSMRVE